MSTQIRLLKEWSDFYEKACGIDEGNEKKKAAPIKDSVKYSLLCQIFEILVHSLPTSRDKNFASDRTFDSLAEFFSNNYQRVISDEVIPSRKNTITFDFEVEGISYPEENRTNLIKKLKI